MSLASGHALGTGPCRYGRLAVYAACACARRVCRTCVHQFCRSRKPPYQTRFFRRANFLPAHLASVIFSWIAPSFPCFFGSPRVTHPDCSSSHRASRSALLSRRYSLLRKVDKHSR
ncbi:hypothetical protein CABS01_09011 [Colletotrichum abscissum]|uniref:uncharacterized protein n=1 Tax=Colletotrichum abscissum TaxID=1671311 RepID=UPI0027D65A8A|nr:uncharacterized protein CABS01_09011 [Colletotrichum abscissum]KAK1503622.1 hypothetical protein CABS01_09011 [Colletotrichum abscissum]